MTISSVKTGAIGDSLLAGNAAFNPSSYESIATVTATSGTTVTFSSIPSTYQHLQIRYYAARSGGAGQLNVRFNSDAGSNYAYHRLRGEGTTASATGGASSARVELLNAVQDSTNAYKASGIIDIHDYASTTKAKTLRNLSGWDANGSGAIILSSGLWTSTAAISSITFDILGDTFDTSFFSLYGIKGA
jgi:hypothetical protein